jgi:hypothetical protein
MIAGRMAVAFLKEALPGQVLKLPQGLKRLSINQLSRLVLDDTRFTDPHNVETRIWRPSLPVWLPKITSGLTQMPRWGTLIVI